MANEQPVFNFYYGNENSLLQRIWNQVQQNGKDIQTLMALTTQEKAALQELSDDGDKIVALLQDLKDKNAATVADLSQKLQDAGVAEATAEAAQKDLQDQLNANTSELDTSLAGLQSKFNAILPIAPPVDTPPDRGNTTVNP